MNAKHWVGGALLTTAFLASSALMAQQMPAAPTASATPQQAMNRMGGQAYKAADPATRAKKMADRLTSDLGLDAATSQKVYTACLDRDQKIDAIQTGSDDNKTKAQKLKANADAFKAAMQGILTPDQFAKFQAMKHHGGGGPAGAPGGDTNR